MLYHGTNMTKHILLAKTQAKPVEIPNLVKTMVEMRLYSFLYSFYISASFVQILHATHLFSSIPAHAYQSPSFQLCHMNMATIVNFCSSTPSQKMCLKPVGIPALGSPVIKRTCRFDQQNRRGQHKIYWENKAESIPSNVRRLFPVMAAKRNSIFQADSLSPSDTIKQFYKCINQKNLKQLSDYISEGCYIEECSFSSPLRGKKQVMNFFEELTLAMGQNLKFSIQNVCEGDDELTAAANWHMDWKDKQMPFTRGCSFFECSKQDGKLVIKKARIVIESPIKPGRLVLTLLKAVTSLFDSFPKAAERFLKSHHIVLQWIWKIYTILLAPIVEGYLGLWNMAVRLLCYAYYIVLFISNIFFK